MSKPSTKESQVLKTKRKKAFWKTEKNEMLVISKFSVFYNVLFQTKGKSFHLRHLYFGLEILFR